MKFTILRHLSLRQLVEALPHSLRNYPRPHLPIEQLLSRHAKELISKVLPCKEPVIVYTENITVEAYDMLAAAHVVVSTKDSHWTDEGWRSVAATSGSRVKHPRWTKQEQRDMGTQNEGMKLSAIAKLEEERRMRQGHPHPTPIDVPASGTPNATEGTSPDSEIVDGV